METQEARLYSNSRLIHNVNLLSGDEELDEILINENGTMTVQVLTTVYKDDGSYDIEVREYQTITRISFK